MFSYGLSFHELHTQFALFFAVGTGRIDEARGLVSPSVVSRLMAVNRSYIKGGCGQTRQCIRSFERCQEICQATRHGNGAIGRNSIEQSTNKNLERFEVCQATRRRNKAFEERCRQ
ncbi:hypothetical protein AVEN_223442-1 [Araneus ventricosus]|uniref:Uncharacterized protein n=1 Tax=Araneus ventricosus TaxID=182803 RepID=A0A4Y2ETK0_ARAVE|nr:hypothetical protein AVEN_223442-1 [Araneus ventricosus]